MGSVAYMFSEVRGCLRFISRSSGKFADHLAARSRGPEEFRRIYAGTSHLQRLSPLRGVEAACRARVGTPTGNLPRWSVKGAGAFFNIGQGVLPFPLPRHTGGAWRPARCAPLHVTEGSTRRTVPLLVDPHH